LDELPFPDLAQVDLSKNHYIFKKGKPLSLILTSRGCPYGCTFCFHGIHGYRWRARSPKNVMEEIRWQVNDLGVGELGFCDDNLTLDQKRAEKICDLISQDKINVPLSTPNGIRVDNINRILLLKMKKAGCWLIVLAPETGDPFVLNKIQKGFTLEQVEKVARWCKDLDFFLVLYIMMGFPFETKENVINSIKFIDKIKPDMFAINRFYPLPGTPITKEYNLMPTEDCNYYRIKMKKEFEAIYNSAYNHFFSNPRNLGNIIKKIGIYRASYSLFKFLASDLKDMFKKNNTAHTQKNESPT
jgi:magnesium-protoporphyrin IX monomethyl ester (oxidative) cyclase